VTHGLPKSIARSHELAAEKKTNLLTAQRSVPIDFTAPKHPNLQASPSLEWDAYLLWRLSERYGMASFSIGKLDKDRVVRLFQLHVLEIVDSAQVTHGADETLVRINVSRRSLNDHLSHLQQRVAGFSVA
jgi:hypothetical protein